MGCWRGGGVLGGKRVAARAQRGCKGTARQENNQTKFTAVPHRATPLPRKAFKPQPHPEDFRGSTPNPCSKPGGWKIVN